MHLSKLLVFALNVFVVQSHSGKNLYSHHSAEEIEDLEDYDDPSTRHTDDSSEVSSHSQQNPTQIATQMKRKIGPSQLKTKNQSPTYTTSVQLTFPSISVHVISSTHSMLFRTEVQIPLSTLLPTKNLTSDPNPQSSLPSSPQTSITSTSPLHQFSNYSDVPPSPTAECVCTPFFNCHDEETSSNLTNIIDDRSILSLCQDTTANKECPGPTEVCCCNMDKPAQQTQTQQARPSTRPSLESSTRPPTKPSPVPSSTTPSTRPSVIAAPKCGGICKPINDCSDEYVLNRDSRLSKNISDKKEGACSDPVHICCQELVLPESPSSVATQETTTQSSSYLTPSLIPIEVSPMTSTLNSSLLRPKPSASLEISNSTNATECICTPFYECYDQETSSNLTALVDDRINDQESISNSTSFVNDTPNPVIDKCSGNDICCFNLVPPSGVIATMEDCKGSCIPIIECSGLQMTFEEAQSGNQEAIHKLRNSVCSRTNETANICCPT